MNKEKRFKVGDTVTFKSKSECGGDYRYGGQDYGGRTTVILQYKKWVDELNCWAIEVDVNHYSMLEYEFVEWDLSNISLPATTKPKNKINFSY